MKQTNKIVVDIIEDNSNVKLLVSVQLSSTRQNFDFQIEKNKLNSFLNIWLIIKFLHFIYLFIFLFLANFYAISAFYY